MKYCKLILILTLLFSSINPKAQVKLIGNEDKASANELSVDAKDNIYATGSFEGHLIVEDRKMKSSGEKDIFIASFTDDMNTRWVRSLGGENNDYANALFTTDNGLSHLLITYTGLITIDNVTFKSKGITDVVIVTFSPSGEILNVNSLLTNGSPMGEDLVIDRNGNYYILLKVVNPIEFQGTTYELEENGMEARLLVKTNKNGETLWVRQIDGIVSDSRSVLKAGHNENIYVGGTFSETLKLNDMQEVANGTNDVFLANYDAKGNLVWVQRSRGEGAEVLRDVGVSAEGSIYLTGFFTHQVMFNAEKQSSAANRDIFLVKYEPDGEVNWLRIASGGFQDDRSSNLILGNNGDVHLTGSYTDGITFYDVSIPGATGKEIFVATYAPNGLVKNLKRAGGSGIERGKDVEILSNDKLVSFGEFTDVATFGDESIKSMGQRDAYLWKF